ncbi:MAG TPA: ATP-binding cassette domain-containing protein [Micromonosporaceae bacterium]|jgi:ABC-2 type transport system ATP-binding protein
MSAIEVDGLVKRYRRASTNAVDGVSFAVDDGALFCLLGPNGAGKTTTISILTTALTATAGRVTVAGFDLDRHPHRIRGAIGVVAQQPSLDANLTAEENLRLHAVLYSGYPWRPAYRLMPATYRRQVADLADVLDVGAALGTPVRRLSGGTRRRLELVRALLHHPRVLFLDEPTTGLDPQSRTRFWAYLSVIRATYRTTVVMTTHYLAEAEPADRLCVIDHGRIVAAGTPLDLTRTQRAGTLEDAYLQLLASDE